VLYGASVTSFTQLFSFAFEKHSNAQVVTIFVNLLFGLMLSQVCLVHAGR
jgi:ABC-type transport system involved in multi-copper enzyme maturation permease subunit